MDIKVVSGDITIIEADAVVVGISQDAGEPSGATQDVDNVLGGAIKRLIERGEAKGKLNEVNIMHTLEKLPSNKVAVVGLGKEQDLTLDRVRAATATVCRYLQRQNCKRIASITLGEGVAGLETDGCAQAMAEGSTLGLYAFRRRVTKEQEYSDVNELIIVERQIEKLVLLERGSRQGKIIAQAANMARDMTNEPANYMTPTNMAESAQRLATTYGLQLKVLETEDIKKLGMGAFLGVAQGSQQPPKLIVLSYKGDSSSTKVVGFIGKGITFDSGGISLKPSEGMEEMKGDMAGGATVMAAICALAELEAKVNVTAVVAATENLPGGGALKPGDVLVSMSGKTIEVVSTDAEGRLTLSDVLFYARKEGLSPIIDLATLTGACRIALGDVCSAIFGNNQTLVDEVVRAGREAGECLWPMPTNEEYKEQNRSEIADIKNTGGKYAGAITAALFLGEFVGDTPWVHIDIAGTSRSEHEKGYLVKGATGFGVRTLVNFGLAISGTKPSRAG